MFVIRKQPAYQYLQQCTFCLDKTEFEMMCNPNVASEIKIFTQDGDEYFTIEKDLYRDLIVTKKTVFDDDGAAIPLFIADFYSLYRSTLRPSRSDNLKVVESFIKHLRKRKYMMSPTDLWHIYKSKNSLCPVVTYWRMRDKERHGLPPGINELLIDHPKLKRKQISSREVYYAAK